MKCARFRDAASARLDGEPVGMSSSTLDAHLASCPDCARWAEDAAVASRLARLDVTPVPDLSAAITASVALPARRVLRRRHWLRVGLFVVGLVQLGVGLPALFGDSVGMAMTAHGTHEAGAWNLALAVAFLAVALVPRRAAGLIPLLVTFLVVLGALSVHDIAAGVVTGDRVATHLAAVAGLLLLIALDRAERALPPGRVAATPAENDSDDGPTTLRTVA